MELLTLGLLAARHARNIVAEELYVRAGIDFTRPVTVSALLNERCNVKCRYCQYWRLDEYAPEMSGEQWKAALGDVRRFAGRYSVNFSGGEPFLRKDLVEILKYCRDSGISAGVTTNGSCLTRGVAARFVAARPFNLNVSVDAPDAATHDYLRGYPGLFEKLCRGIGFVREECTAQGIRVPIIIKPTVNARNFRHLPQLVEWAQEIGASAVYMQPMDRWTRETYDELWVERPESDALAEVIEQLIQMKRAGAPILNPDHILRAQVAHFREERLPAVCRKSRLGLGHLIIRSNGGLQLAFDRSEVGNVNAAPMRQIWTGAAARGLRRRLVDDGGEALNTAMFEKSFADKVRMGLTLFTRAVRPRAAVGNEMPSAIVRAPSSVTAIVDALERRAAPRVVPLTTLPDDPRAARRPGSFDAPGKAWARDDDATEVGSASQ